MVPATYIPGRGATLFSILLFPVAPASCIPGCRATLFLFSYSRDPSQSFSRPQGNAFFYSLISATPESHCSGKLCPQEAVPQKAVVPESHAPRKLCPRELPAASKCEVQERYVRTSHNVRDAADQQQDVHCRRYVCACLSLSPGQAVQPFAELRYAAQHGEN